MDMTNITEKLAEVFSNIGVKSTYGSAVEVDGATIIPVAIASFGFGAGEGLANDAENTEGSGGGGGGMSVPIGAYITRDGITRFEPNTIVLVAVGVPLVWATGRALACIAKAFKR